MNTPQWDPNMNAVKLTVKTDPVTIEKMTAAYEKLAAHNRQLQQNQVAAMYRVLDRR